MRATPEKFLRLLPLGRNILLLVVVVTLTLALFLQVVGMLVVRGHLEETHTHAGITQSALLAAGIDATLQAGNKEKIAALIETARSIHPGLLYVAVCDREGALLAPPSSPVMSEKFEAWIRARSTPSAQPAVLNVRTEKGDVLHVVQPLAGGRDGYLHSGYSWVPVDAAVRHVCLSMLAAMLCGLLISGCVAWFSFSRMARPIVKLVETVQEFGTGRLSARVLRQPGARNEADLLAGAFNEMADRLEQQVEDLVRSHAELSVEKARVHAVLDSMPHSVVVTGQDGRILHCNRAARTSPAACGHETAQTYSELRANRPLALRAFEQVAAGHEVSRRIQEKVEGRDLEVSITRASSAAGECLGIVEITRDVTQQLQSWRALAHADKLNVVGQLAAVVAHEINSPLDGAIEASRIVERYATEPEKIRHFARAQRSGLERIAVIVRRLLTFSRMPGGTEWEQVRVSRLLDETRALLHHRLTKVKLDFPPPETPDPLVQGDEFGLVQILVNLLNNAIDATPAGGTVQVEVRSGAGQIAISVLDQGPGISKETAGKLFGSFFTTKEAGKGTGLGLVVSRKIAEEHGGRIDFVNADAPWGARFTVTLPDGGLRDARHRRLEPALARTGEG